MAELLTLMYLKQTLWAMSTPILPDNDTARLAFLLRLVDTIHAMPDAVAIEEAVCRMLAEYLQVEHACFVTISADRRTIVVRNEYIRERCASLACAWASCHPQGLIKAIETEQSFILDDAAALDTTDQQDKAFYACNHIRSCMAFPVGKGKQTLTYIAVADAAPHHWTARDISLVHETAARLADAIERGGAGKRQNVRNDELLRKCEQQILDLLRLRDEREHLIQMLNAQIDRLNKLMRHVLETTPA